MNPLKKLQHVIGFTDREGYVAAFLVAAFLLGLGVKLFHAPEPSKTVFNYRASDSEFTARSQIVLADDSLGDGVDTIAFQRAPVQQLASVAPQKEISQPRRVVNINTASHDELVTLPAIGDSMANRIIAYRAKHGLFKTIEEVKKVKGIGKKKYEKLAPLITVSK